MTFSTWLLDVFIASCILLAAGLYLYGRASRRARLLERTRAEIGRQGSVAGGSQIHVRDWKRHALAGLQRLGRLLPLLSESQRNEASGKLVMAGLRSNTALFVVAGITVLCVGALGLAGLLVMAPMLAGFGFLPQMLCVVGLMFLGSLVPRLALDRMVASRQQKIREALPDALDLLVICTRSGLGLNAALERVADELAFVYPAMSDEFKLTATELKLSSDTERVLKRLAERVGIGAVQSLVGALLQARQFGTPLTQALKVLAKTERTARMMSMEEQAAKLSVKTTIPMMLFILPTVVIVGVGPAMLSMMKTFAH